MTGSHLSLDERLSLISSIFSDRGEVDAVVQLTADDAQAFIDVIDEVNPYAVSRSIAVVDFG